MITEGNLLALRESEELFRLLVETKDYAIIMLSPNGNIISWNIGAEYMLGYAFKEIYEHHISVCYSDTGKKNRVSKQLMESAILGRVEVEETLIKKDGSPFFANIVYTPVHVTPGKAQGFASIIRDITVQKRKAAESKALQDELEKLVRQRTKELETVNKELNAFSYSVSHDLRTPLRAISGFSKMVLDEYAPKLDAEGKRIVNTIIESAEMMGKLIDDLLSFSRLSRMEISDQAIDMKSIAQKCINELTQIWNKKKYSVTIDDLPCCYADATMMKQVWMNLIENALKYSSSKDHPTLKISATEHSDCFTYVISDNGVGFDMQYADKLFGVFQRLHADDEFPGTGLGLALVNRIISKHGGRVWAESEVDKGAIFYFSIPKK